MSHAPHRRRALICALSIPCVVQACGSTKQSTHAQEPPTINISAASAATSVTAIAKPPRTGEPTNAEIRPITPNRSGSTLRAGMRFVGTYFCSQGETDAILTIDDVEPDHTSIAKVELTFDFTYVPGQIHGILRESGTFDTDTNELKMIPEEWVLQPPGYRGVPMTATVDRNARVIDGTLDDPSCGGIHVRRN